MRGVGDQRLLVSHFDHRLVFTPLPQNRNYLHDNAKSSPFTPSSAFGILNSAFPPNRPPRLRLSPADNNMWDAGSDVDVASRHGADSVNEASKSGHADKDSSTNLSPSIIGLGRLESSEKGLVGERKERMNNDERRDEVSQLVG